MGGIPHWRRGHLAWLQAAADERSRAGTLRRDRGTLERCTDARLVPAIGTALKAGYRWFDVYCGGCHQVKRVDLASTDIRPQACLRA
jgi:mono/diheme cytochrome c family protein